MLKKFVQGKKIVVTGSKGFIGAYLMKALPNAMGWDIKEGNDIFDPTFMQQTADADVIIHLAAQTSLPASLNNPDYTRTLNMKGTLRVLLAAEQNGAKVIFASSAAVYSPSDRNTIRETDELASDNPYGRSKISSEYLCGAFRDKLPIVVLRLFNVYGFSPLPQEDSVITNFTNGIREKKLVINGDGRQVRDFIKIDDVVRVIVDAVNNDDYVGKYINVGTGVGTSINDLAGYFRGSKKKKIEVVYSNDPTGVDRAVADNTLLRNIYGRPLVSNLEKDIKEVI